MRLENLTDLIESVYPKPLLVLLESLSPFVLFGLFPSVSYYSYVTRLFKKKFALEAQFTLN